MRQGVLHETSSATYRFDLPAYDNWKRTLHRRVGLSAGSAAATAALIGIFAQVPPIMGQAAVSLSLPKTNRGQGRYRMK